MTHCPGSTQAGCRCPEHHPGLSIYSRDPDAYNRMLDRIQPTRLHIVTPGPPTREPECTGGYLCRCPDCLSSSARPRNHPKRQPWRPKPISDRHRPAA